MPGCRPLLNMPKIRPPCLPKGAIADGVVDAVHVIGPDQVVHKALPCRGGSPRVPQPYDSLIFPVPRSQPRDRSRLGLLRLGLPLYTDITAIWAPVS